jgi:putative restriction endonuclease
LTEPGKASGDVTVERATRLELWSQLEYEGATSIEAGRLRELGVYGGAQGIWVDKARTGELTPDGAGIAVSVLHTGASYADDLSEDGLLYHYPKTARPAARDAGEVEALKWAQRYEMPVFTITHAGGTGNHRHVRLSWVDDFDDKDRLFLLSFADAPEGRVIAPPDEAPFFLTATSEEKKALHKVRVGQQRFAMSVFRRYGGECAVCVVSVSELVDAAHLCAAGQSGANDARNGLPLCALHHRAFDRGFWAIEPGTYHLAVRPQGPSLDDLRITSTSIDHLPALPHPAAIEHVWRQFNGG